MTADKQTGNNKILLINGFDFLGRNLIDYIISKNLPYSIYIVEKNIDSNLLNSYASNDKVKILNYNLFFKSDLSSETFGYIIYNALAEKGQGSELIASLNNVKRLFDNANTQQSEFILLTNVNPEQKKDKKIDFQNSAIAVAEEYLNLGVKTKILYIGDIYGPEMNLEGNTPLTSIIKNATKSNDIILDQEEDFRYYIYIEDANNGIFHALGLQQSGAFTLAEPYDISLSSIALRISEILGKRLISKVKPIPQDHLKTLPYILPGWRPEVSFERGLEKTFDWIKDTNALRNAQSLNVKPVSSDDINNQPIRNYQPNTVSVFREIPDNPIEINSIYDSHKGSKSLKNINDLKAKLGAEEAIEETSRFKAFVTPFAFKREKYSNTKNEKSSRKYDFSDFYKPKKKTIFFIFLTILFVLIYIFILIPTFWTGVYYFQIQKDMGNIQANADGIFNKSIQLKNNFQSLEWVFGLTHQQTRYDNFLETIRSLNDISKSQLNYAGFESNIHQFYTSFAQQDESVANVITNIPNITTYNNTYNSLAISFYDISQYNPFFPGNTVTIKNIITDELSATANTEAKYSLIPELLGIDSKYISIVTKDQNSNFSSDNIKAISILSFKNGIYQGTVPLASPSKKDSAQSFISFANDIETQYSGNFTGVIMVDSEALSALDASSPNDIIKKLIGDTQNGYINTLKNQIQKDNIIIYINNQAVSKNDIIRSLN